MSQFESPFEEKLYAQRQEKLREIQALGVKLGLTPAEAIYPNRFPSADEAIPFAQIPDLVARYDGDPQSGAPPISAEQLEAEHPTVAVAGRIMAIRLQGKAGFAHLQQGGKRLQIYVRKDDVGEDAFTLYKLLDLGDHIGVRGALMRTRTGELTLKALPLPNPSGQPKPAISFLAKAMLALPDKYHGLEDVELRYRQRYVDLIMNSGTLAKQETPAPNPGGPDPSAPNPGAPSSPAASSPVKVGFEPQAPEQTTEPLNVRETFVRRAAILRAIRRFFDARNFLEVETPMMHTIAGGAAARPFKTHHNALDIPLSLRIAPELYLKRLVVGGLDRVYEINRNFRNEGVSTQHNPEFTMLEFYQAYANYHDLMELTQELIQFVATEVNGTTKTRFNGTEIDLGKWQKLSMREAIIKFWPDQVPVPSMADFESATQLAARLRSASKRMKARRSSAGDTQEALHIEDTLPSTHAGRERSRLADVEVYFEEVATNLEHRNAPLETGKIIAELFEALAEEHLIQPTIIYDFPLAVSPLSKVKPDEPDWVERFEFYIGGFEVGNAFSELNDPDDQRRRFEDQLKERDRGDDEAHAMDEDYVRALSFGLPPTAGEGVGIDRLTMILTGARSIRDVILFPLLRPRSNSPEGPGPTSIPGNTPEAQPHGESAE